MAPQNHTTRRRRFDIPPEEACPIGSLKPDLFKRQPAEPSPVSILPRLGMIDEELVKNAHRVISRKAGFRSAVRRQTGRTGSESPARAASNGNRLRSTCTH